jgi:hypothetical protein
MKISFTEQREAEIKHENFHVKNCGLGNFVSVQINSKFRCLVKICGSESPFQHKAHNGGMSVSIKQARGIPESAWPVDKNMFICFLIYHS